MQKNEFFMVNKFYIKGIRRFHYGKVKELFQRLAGKDDELRIEVEERDTHGDEREAYRVVADLLSTQGVSVRFLWSGIIVVELPWVASHADVQLCYTLLRVVKRIHRAARILNKDEKEVRLTDDDEQRHWMMIREYMAELLTRNERTIIAGVNRDFYLNLGYYAEVNDLNSRVEKAFDDFTALQWTCVEAKTLMEEQRCVEQDEDLSLVRVVDNTCDAFVGECRYVGMMRDNDCKMVPFEDFCTLMSHAEGFKRMDEAQALVFQMDPKVWNVLYEQAPGRVLEHYRKTFIMRWNTDISNYHLYEFREAMGDFYDPGFYYEWSIWDYRKVHLGDTFYMIRTGSGRQGVVMHGTIIGRPYPDEDWSGKGRRVYYIRMRLDAMIDPDAAPLLLTTDQLGEAVPDFDWTTGHSGVMLTDSQAVALQRVWQEYAGRLRDTAPDNPSICMLM